MLGLWSRWCAIIRNRINGVCENWWLRRCRWCSFPYHWSKKNLKVLQSLARCTSKLCSTIVTFLAYSAPIGTKCSRAAPESISTWCNSVRRCATIGVKRAALPTMQIGRTTLVDAQQHHRSYTWSSQYVYVPFTHDYETICQRDHAFSWHVSVIKANEISKK